MASEQMSMLCRHFAGQEDLSHSCVAVQAEAVNPQSLGMLAQLMHQTEQAETSEAAWLLGMTVR